MLRVEDCVNRGVNALVTGASKGIGQAIAIRLAKSCARVAVNYRRDQEGAKETLRKIEELGGEGILVQGDVSDPAQVSRMVEEVHEGLGKIQVLVSNAGVGYAVPFKDLSVELFDKQIAVNLRGAFLVSRAFLDDMMSSGWGRIVFVSSIAGITGAEYLSAYSAAKAGLIGLAKSMALELGEYNITVNVVAPGFVSTRLGYSYFKYLGEKLGVDLLDLYLRDRTLLGRLSTVDEVAEAVLLVARRDVGSITGEVIVIDSGTVISSGRLPRIG